MKHEEKPPGSRTFFQLGEKLIQVFFTYFHNVHKFLFSEEILDYQFQPLVLTFMYEFSFLFVGSTYFLEHVAKVEITSHYFVSVVYILEDFILP